MIVVLSHAQDHGVDNPNYAAARLAAPKENPAKKKTTDMDAPQQSPRTDPQVIETRQV
jgi:hypothetical protein